MTASLTQADRETRGGSRTAGTVAAGLIGATVVIFLLMAGLTFFGLAIAFPIAIPVANAYHLYVSAADAALAQQFAGFWWVFLGLAVASVGAAAAVTIKLVSYLSPAPRD